MAAFEDKIVLVTGGTRGIGRACVTAFASEGARVALCGRDAVKASQAAAEIADLTGAEVKGYGADVADSDAAGALVKAVTEDLGPISVLVNNAGVTRDGLIMRMKDADWESVLATNLSGAFHCARSVTRGMLKLRYGRIINISSIVGIHGQAGQTNYAAAKAGLIGFSKALAQELASRNITVNVVAPGYVDTDMTAGLSEDAAAVLRERIPLHRQGAAEEIAHAVLFLASDEASYITGVVLPVDGGLGM